jgi:hypothetical protein
MRTISPDIFQDLSSTAIVLGGDFEHRAGVIARTPDSWPQLSIEAQMRVTAFGVVACSGSVDNVKQVIFSGGIEAGGPDGKLVDEAITMEHVFQSLFSQSARKGITIVKDGDCNTTRTSAQSVHKLLAPQQHAGNPRRHLFITSEAHGPRAEDEFQKRKGVPIQLVTAEEILLNAAIFGWRNEANTRFSQQASDYMHSWRARRMRIQERGYRVLSSSALGDFAERKVATRRAAA